MEKTFACYTIAPGSKALKARLTAQEGALEAARNAMELGYSRPSDGVFVAASSVLLRTTMRTSSDEALRKACYDGVRTIGPAVLPALCEVVKMRGELARSQGFATFYDAKVTAAEGFGESTLFELLDALEERTRPLMEEARARVAAEKGARRKLRRRSLCVTPRSTTGRKAQR
jgi:Zn-dependent oligopeptidase